MPRYPIPAGRTRIEEVILRSRFISTAGPAPTVEAARAFIAGVREEFPGANHNCYAYLVGSPGSSAKVGMSDDGEPSGTAGRPMLAILSGSGIGDVVVVVTRYFGGIKLGTGGLVRAYGSGVKAVLTALPTVQKVSTVELWATGSYAFITPVGRLLPEFEAEIVEQDYAAHVTWLLRVPVERADALADALVELSHGAIHVDRPGNEN